MYNHAWLIHKKKSLGDIKKELTQRKKQEQNYGILTEKFQVLNGNDTTDTDQIDIIEEIKEAAEEELKQANAVLNAFDENIQKVDLNKFKKGFIEDINKEGIIIKQKTKDTGAVLDENIKKDINTGITKLKEKIKTTQEDIVEYLLYYRNYQSVVNTKNFIEKNYPRLPTRKDPLQKSLEPYFKQVNAFENNYRPKKQTIIGSLDVDKEVYDITPHTSHTTTPYHGGKRRKSRRNRKSKKSKKSRKNHRKSNRRR